MSFKEQLDFAAIEACCRRWYVAELAMFGSARRNELRPDSDVDVLVSFERGAEPTLFEFSRMAREWSQLFGREVDVVTRRGVEESRNPYRRGETLETVGTLYAA